MRPPLPVTTFSTCSGNPASRKNSAVLSALSGVCFAGFSTTLLPAAIAGPSLWATRLNGKLNGVIAPMIPSGSRIVKPMRPLPASAASMGIVSP